MTLFALGINHRSAPVDLREKVAFVPDRIIGALHEVRMSSSLNEVAILSTCNRTELYCSAESPDQQPIVQWLGGYHGLDVLSLEKCTYLLRNEDAAKHMMRVASGLDSMVLGEPQILGQMKSAYSLAQEAQTVGGPLDRLFRQTFSVAKRVRTETTIGENPVSVAYAAVNMASRIFSDMSENTALLIGAGETVELVAKHLFRVGVKSIIVANRTLSRARDVARQFGGEAISLADIPPNLHRADIVIASTASSLPILGKGAVERAVKQRKHSPIFMVDIAVPRDIEPEVAELADVFLYTVDDLRQVIEESIKSREGAALEAEHLIEAGAADFMYHLRALQSVSVLKEFRGLAEAFRDAEVEKALRQLRNGEDPEAIVQTLARGLTSKLIHQPTVQVRKATAEGRIEVTDWLRDLYQLPDEGDENGR